MTDNRLCIDGTRAHRMSYESPNGPLVSGICTRGCGRTVTQRSSGDFYGNENTGWQTLADTRKRALRNLLGQA